MKSNKARCLVLVFLNVLVYTQADEVIRAARCLKAPPPESRCKAAKTAYFYNAVSGVCESFLYGGCPGVSDGAVHRHEPNVFNNLQDCVKTCGTGIKGACSEPMCLIECRHGFLTDINGCKTCECKPGLPGPPLIAACPLKACVKECINGYEMDAKGCQTCTCKNDGPPSIAVCQPIACPDICPGGYVLDSKGCQTCECREKVPDCPAIECYDSCPRGYAIDSDGCQTCQCIKPNPDCLLGPRCMMYCENDYMLDQQGCPRCVCASYPPKKPTKPKCSEATCLMHCPAGFRKDDNGCPLCACAPDPCEVIDCRPSEVCVKDDTNPKRIKVRCVPKPGSETGKSGTKEEEGFGLMMAVVAAVITFTLISLIAAVCIMICKRRQYRRRAEAIYKPIDSAVHM